MRRCGRASPSPGRTWSPARATTAGRCNGSATANAREPAVRADWTGGLSDGVVTVRHLAPADAPAFVQAFADDPTLGAMIGSEKDPTVEEVERQAREVPHGQVAALAIAEPGTSEFLGG